MNIDEAYSKIENCHGFDDTTSVVGEAWERVKVEIATLQSQLAASQERETVSMNSDNLCTPHKIFLNSQNLTGCVLCERNKEIEDLKAQLAASQERERILRDGLGSIGDGSGIPVYCAVCTMKRADEVEP